MKKVLITGVNSYVGNKLATWLEKYKYLVDKISLRDNKWQNEVFSKYDVIIHVAGIVHLAETKKNTDLYYRVNRDLTYELAKKAKTEGVKQFVFMSSMSVYGVKKGAIYNNTLPMPKSNYGKSKLQGEKLLEKLNGDRFKVAILRPPMIYGKVCTGNYRKLAEFAAWTPIFPDIDNKRSMLYIDNLTEFIKILIDNYEKGIFFPQNREYVKTSEMVKLIANEHGNNIRLTKLFNPVLRLLRINVIDKVFGDLYYMNCNNDIKNMKYIDFKESIKITEN